MYNSAFPKIEYYLYNYKEISDRINKLNTQNSDLDYNHFNYGLWIRTKLNRGNSLENQVVNKINNECIIKKLNLWKKLIQEDSEIEEIIEDADINKTYGILLYLGWDDVRGKVVDTLSDALYSISNEEISYRLTIIGENLEDIEEQSYTAKEDENLNIPFPSIIRTFDEKDLERQMDYFILNKENPQKEDIDI